MEQLHSGCKALAKEPPPFSKGRIWHYGINGDVKEVQRKDRKKQITRICCSFGMKGNNK